MTFAVHGSMANEHHAYRSVISRRWLVLAMVTSTALVAIMMLANRLVVNPDNWGLWAALVPCAALGLLRHKTRLGTTAGQMRLRDFSEHGITLIVICLLGALASYEAACDTSGFADAELAKCDRILHFNWLTWYGVVVRHPTLQHLGAGVYSTIWVTPWLLITYLAWMGNRPAARRFLFTFWLSIVLTLLLFPLFPAKGPLDYLWHGPIPYMPTNGLYQGEIIPALRAHIMTRIDVGSVKGLVCAPSFHTVSAVVFIASVWPYRILRRFFGAAESGHADGHARRRHALFVRHDPRAWRGTGRDRAGTTGREDAGAAARTEGIDCAAVPPNLARQMARSGRSHRAGMGDEVS